MRGLLHISVMGALLSGATVVITAAPAQAQGSYSPYNESPAAALARYVHFLADDPKNFDSLIGAGRAALEMGDTQAAAGFFARADEANPRSPLPQAGMRAVSVGNGEPQAALPYFRRAQQLGANQRVEILRIVGEEVHIAGERRRRALIVGRIAALRLRRCGRDDGRCAEQQRSHD